MAGTTARAASANPAAQVAELTARLTDANATIARQDTTIIGLEAALGTAKGKIAELGAELAAANARATAAEESADARASKKAQEILAACGAPPVAMAPRRQHPAAGAKPGEGATGLERMRAVTAAQIQQAKQTPSNY